MYSLQLLPFLVAVTYGCKSICQVRFCDNNNTITLDTPDRPLSSPLCDGPHRLRNTLQAGEALVFGMRISRYSPPGLLQRFTPTFFKLYHNYTGTLAIGHETAQQNQLYFARNLCVVLPLTGGHCVSFRANVLAAELSPPVYTNPLIRPPPGADPVWPTSWPVESPSTTPRPTMVSLSPTPSSYPVASRVPAISPTRIDVPVPSSERRPPSSAPSLMLSLTPKPSVTVTPMVPGVSPKPTNIAPPVVSSLTPVEPTPTEILPSIVSSLRSTPTTIASPGVPELAPVISPSAVPSSTPWMNPTTVTPLPTVVMKTTTPIPMITPHRAMAPLPEVTPSTTTGPSLAGRVYHVRFSGFLMFDSLTTASYTRGNGRLIGNYNPRTRVFSGRWGEPRAFVRCWKKGPTGTHAWGEVYLQFSEDLRSFRGYWNYCRRPLSFKWAGRQRM